MTVFVIGKNIPKYFKGMMKKLEKLQKLLGSLQNK